MTTSVVVAATTPLKGGAGNDTIRGAGGDDNIYGQKGKDKCNGGGGINVVKCEKTLKGGKSASGPCGRSARCSSRSYQAVAR